MSNVIISYNWPYKTKNGISPTMCFYDGLRIALEESNHDVLEINTANFCTNVEIDEISKNSILEINNNIFYEHACFFSCCF